MTTATKNNTKNKKQVAKDFANEIRHNFIAIELQMARVSRSRQLSGSQKREVAEHFAADHKAVGGNKRLYAPNQPEIKAITSVISDATRLWREYTISYRKGIRLMRKDSIDAWESAFDMLQTRLADALAEADRHYDEIIAASREFLGEQLFNAGDYPDRFADSVAISWGVHNFEPSEELMQLAPATYQREQQRVRQQMEDAVAKFEDEMRDQMAELVAGLIDKLDAAANGKRVVYTEATTKNLRDFFDRFESMGIFSDQQLADLIDEAREVLGNTSSVGLKKSSDTRQQIAAGFKKVQIKLDKQIIEAPARSISIDDLDD